MKLAAMGLALKDSPPGFIPTSVESYDEGYDTDAYHGVGEYGAPAYSDVDYGDGSYQETEQL
jgi:DNA-directed RNA polymerase subunit alpha